MLIVAAFPVLTATFAMLLLDRYCGFHFFTNTGGALLVLDATRVLLVRGGERLSAPISATHPWPRDMRGRLSAGAGAFTGASWGESL